MVLLLVPLAVGLVAGYLLRDVEGVPRLAERAMQVLVVVLLFLLGLEAGGDPRVVAGIGRLGVEAAVLGLAATGASVVAVAWLLPDLGVGP